MHEFYVFFFYYYFTLPKKVLPSIELTTITKVRTLILLYKNNNRDSKIETFFRFSTRRCFNQGKSLNIHHCLYAQN